METVKAYAGRMNGGDFEWTFTDADDLDYAVNTELKAAITGYTTSIVSIGGTDPSKCLHEGTTTTQRVEATCTTKGYITYACADEGCDAVKKEEIPELGHALVFTEQTAPTCTTNGVKKFKCLRASCTSGTIIEEIPALGHDVKTYEEISATCKEDGHDAYEECLRNGCNHNTYNKQDALGHEYDATDKCIRCGYL